MGICDKCDNKELRNATLTGDNQQPYCTYYDAFITKEVERCKRLIGDDLVIDSDIQNQ